MTEFLDPIYDKPEKYIKKCNRSQPGSLHLDNNT